MKELIYQSEILLRNIEDTLYGIEEKYYKDQSVFKWTIGEQLYHLLTSLDKWFINPSLPITERKEDLTFNNKEIEKEYLIEYFRKIKNKIECYLKNIDDPELNEKPEGCAYTRLELIIAQCRHTMYHIGFIHACIRIKTGSAPKYVGPDNFTPVQ